MNVLKGHIQKIVVEGSLSLVHIRVHNVVLTSIVIDKPGQAPYLNQDSAVDVIFKETEVIIGKGHEHAISMQNKLKGHVLTIKKEKLLSKIRVETEAGEISAVITTDAVHQLKLHEGSEITALIKTNEIMLAE